MSPRPNRLAEAGPQPTTVVAHPDSTLADEITQAWQDCQVAISHGDKSALRQLHLLAKRQDAEVRYGDLRKDFEKLKGYFPEPNQITPALISPRLIPVSSHRSLEGRLFRIARGTWSMPFSKGYGRRLRFLVMDDHHNALIGILGLQSPSADLGCRDLYFGLAKSEKLSKVNNTMDAYTVGAMPAYAPLLAGKLVAGLIHSNIVRQAYWRVYGGRRTKSEDINIAQPLLAVTTASAFGRSSIYNRLKFENRTLAKPLGYTKGFGTIHLEGVYPRIVDWLKSNDRHVPAGFGNGPKVRWQNIMRALGDLKIPREYLSHGMKREVFIFEFAENLTSVLRNNEIPQMYSFDDRAWSSHWMERWCLPRAERNPDWNQFNAHERIASSLSP